MAPEHKPEWFREHEESEKAVFITRDEMRKIMSETITDYFEKKGTISKNLLIATATVITSITLIVGGLKIILGWFGINILSK